MKKLLLFDLDGVLVDACDWHYIALNKALREVCDFEITRYDHENRFNGLPTAVKLKMLNLNVDQSQQVWKLKQSNTIEVINQNASIDHDKIDMHKYFKQLGYKIGCVTNSIRQTAVLMLEKTGQLPFIDILITNEDVEHSKPSPDCYIKAIQDFGFTGKEKNVYIIEDSEKGKQAARQTLANLIEVKNPDEVTKIFLIEEFQRNENTDSYGR